jgi:hypothetical protein
MDYRHWRLGLGVVALGVCGCSPYFAWPSLLHPGPAAYQRDRAQLFDPYPEADEFPSDLNQVRPPGFATPSAEVKRSRIFSRPNLPTYVPAGNNLLPTPIDNSAAAAPVSFY